MSVRLAPGVDPAEVAPLLEGGWQVGGAVATTVQAVRASRPGLPDPTRIWRVPRARLDALRARGVVSEAWGHPRPPPPPTDPADLPPETPNLEPEQTWRRALAVDGATWWPGGDGDGVYVADIEYDWDPQHEDLTNAGPEVIGGVPLGEYAYHGTAVIGIVAARADGFGTTGGAPASTVLVVHPVDGEDNYDVASAILLAIDALAPGDVLLVEQQALTDAGLAPASAEPAVDEAIRVAVAAGLIVVEPAGNGGLDLDASRWNGWFDRQRDSGSIVVGGATAAGGWDGRSNHGQRVDVHAHAVDVAAPTGSDFRPDLFFPDGDPHQAYTSGFGGTSGASAQVASLAAAAQGVSRALHGGPASPAALRSWMVTSGAPQEAETAVDYPIGVRPDLRRLLRGWLFP